MMRTFHRVPSIHESSRRETVGLFGAFLVMLLGLPSHSATLIESAKETVRQFIQLILVFLGLATPVVQGPAIPAAPAVHPKPLHARVKVDPNSMLLRSDPILHRFIYLFKGKATLNGQPCPKASVLVRLLAGDNTVAKGTVTEDDGTYSLEVAIDAADRSPVDWAMEAYTADFKKVELSGRQIVQREEDPGQEPDKQPIIVTNPVEFIVSLSK